MYIPFNLGQTFSRNLFPGTYFVHIMLIITVLPLILEELWNIVLKIELLYLLMRVGFTSRHPVRSNKIQHKYKATTYII